MNNSHLALVEKACDGVSYNVLGCRSLYGPTCNDLSNPSIKCEWLLPRVCCAMKEESLCEWLDPRVYKPPELLPGSLIQIPRAVNCYAVVSFHLSSCALFKDFLLQTCLNSSSHCVSFVPNTPGYQISRQTHKFFSKKTTTL